MNRLASFSMRDETAKDNSQTAAWISHALTQQRAGFFLVLQKRL